MKGEAISEELRRSDGSLTWRSSTEEGSIATQDRLLYLAADTSALATWIYARALSRRRNDTRAPERNGPGAGVPAQTSCTSAAPRRTWTCPRCHRRPHSLRNTSSSIDATN